MKKQHGYTLLETLIAMLIVAALGASGLYGWQRWQQQQRLWQTACQVRDYLLQLREDANWRVLRRISRCSAGKNRAELSNKILLIAMAMSISSSENPRSFTDIIWPHRARKA